MLLPMFSKMTHYTEEQQMALYGPYATKKDLMTEIAMKIALWDFYMGPGQEWTLDDNIDYVPSKEKLNFTKEIIDRQNMILTNKKYQINITPLIEGTDVSKIIQLIRVVEENSKIQNIIKNMDLEKSVMKKSALRIIGNRDKQILKVVNHNPLEFFHSTDDDGTLLNVNFHYLTEETYYNVDENKEFFVGNYYLENGKCLWDAKIKDAKGKVVKNLSQMVDTGLDFIPVEVFINNPQIDSYNGYSDVTDIEGLQRIYNMIVNAMVDNIGFDINKMIKIINNEMNKSKNSDLKLKIKPGSMFELDKGQDIAFVANETNIVEVLNFVNKIKDEAYQLKHQPTNSQLATAKSGKEIENMYNALEKYCATKFSELDDGLKNVYRNVVKVNNTLGIYPELVTDVPFNIEILPNFDIFDDVQTDKENMIKLAEIGKLSIRTLLEKVAGVEDAEAEFARIIEEQKLLSGASNDAYLTSVINNIK